MDRPPPLPPPLTTPGDLLALAHALEKEAASRYLNLASKMRLCGEMNWRNCFYSSLILKISTRSRLKCAARS